MNEQLEMAGLDDQPDLFFIGPPRRKPDFDSEVWKRAERLYASQGLGALMMMSIRMSDDLLPDDDRQFFVDVRRAIKWMDRKRRRVGY